MLKNCFAPFLINIDVSVEFTNSYKPLKMRGPNQVDICKLLAHEKGTSHLVIKSLDILFKSSHNIFSIKHPIEEWYDLLINKNDPSGNNGFLINVFWIETPSVLVIEQLDHAQTFVETFSHICEQHCWHQALGAGFHKIGVSLGFFFDTKRSLGG